MENPYCSCRLTRVGMVGCFKATTLSWSAVSLSWGWTAEDRPAKFAISRNKGNKLRDASLMARQIESEVVPSRRREFCHFDPPPPPPPPVPVSGVSIGIKQGGVGGMT